MARIYSVVDLEELFTPEDLAELERFFPRQIQPRPSELR